MNLTIEIAVLGKRYADVRAVDRLSLQVAEGASNGEIARALHISAGESLYDIARIAAQGSGRAFCAASTWC